MDSIVWDTQKQTSLSLFAADERNLGRAGQSYKTAWSGDSRFVAMLQFQPGIRVFDIVEGKEILKRDFSARERLVRSNMSTHPFSWLREMDAPVWAGKSPQLVAALWSNLMENEAELKQPLEPSSGGDRSLSPARASVPAPSATSGSESVEDAGMVSTLAWRPDSKQIALLGTTGTIRIRDLATGKTVHRFDPKVTNGTAVGSIAWSPDGRFLATLGHENVQIIDIANRENAVRTIFTAHAGPMGRRLPSRGVSLAWSPDGKLLAALVPQDRPRVLLKVWEVTEGKEILSRPLVLTSRGTAGAASGGIAWSFDSRRLAVGVDELRVLDVTSGKQETSLATEPGADPFWTRDGLRLVARCDGRHGLSTTSGDHIGVWDAATGVELLTITGPAAQWELSPDCRSLASVISKIVPVATLTVKEDVCEGRKASLTR
jgi:WD40 repeat protein